MKGATGKGLCRSTRNTVWRSLSFHVLYNCKIVIFIASKIISGCQTKYENRTMIYNLSVLQALLGIIPYTLFVILTKARIQPVLNEAMDMLLLTNGAFETVNENRTSRTNAEDGEEEELDSDDSDDTENYAKR